VEEKTVIIVEQANPRSSMFPATTRSTFTARPLPVSPHLLPTGGLLRGGNGHFLRRRHGDWSRLGRRMGLGLRMGHNDIDVDINNDFNRNTNINRGDTNINRAATGQMSAAVIPNGSTIRSIAAQPPIRTVPRRINMAAPPVGIRCPIVRQARARVSASREAACSPARWIAVRAAAAAPAQAPWTEASAAREETVSGTGAFLPHPAAETTAPSAEPRAAQAEAPPGPAAAGLFQLWRRFPRGRSGGGGRR